MVDFLQNIVGASMQRAPDKLKSQEGRKVVKIECLMRRTKRRLKTNFRKDSGIYLVEILVALILGALLSFTLLQILSETMRVTTSSGNRQLADLIAQTVLDSAKKVDFDNLAIGKYPLVVNSSVLAPAGHPLPVGLDLSSLTWKAKSISNSFKGNVDLEIAQTTDPTVLSAIVTVSWSDSQAATMKVSTATTIHRKGVNYWL
jgi:Tfp pilus assembly protein PilX